MHVRGDFGRGQRLSRLELRIKSSGVLSVGSFQETPKSNYLEVIGTELTQRLQIYDDEEISTQPRQIRKS